MFAIDATDTAIPIQVEQSTATTLEIANLEELLAALSGDVSGYVLQLQPGDYVGIDINGLNPPAGVSITSADPDNPARLDEITISNSSNISMTGLIVTSDDGPVAAWGEHIFRVDNSANIDLSGNSFVGRPGAQSEGFIGLFIVGSDGVNLSDNEFTNLYRGAVMLNSDNLLLTDNVLHNLGTDAFDFSGVQQVTIEGNRFTELHPVGGDHADYIQFWTAGAIRPTTDIVIRNNFMAQSVGESSQAIFFGNEDDIPYENIVIENNLVYQSGYHGITVYDAVGVEVRDNTVISHTETDRKTSIRLFDVQNSTVESNISNTVYVSGAQNVETGNIVTELVGQIGNLSYPDVFARALGRYTDHPLDFEVLPTINAGADLSLLLHPPTAGDDVIASSLMDDTLIGGAGDDSYLFNRDDSTDQVDNRGEAGSFDRLKFGPTIDSDQLWFSQSGDDLLVSVIGTTDAVSVQDWYADNGANQLAQFETSNGEILIGAQVDSLVSAMAAFNPPPLGQLELTQAEHDNLDPVIDAAWQ